MGVGPQDQNPRPLQAGPSDLRQRRGVSDTDSGNPTKGAPLRFDWQTVYWIKGRHYAAKVSDVLTLDVYRRMGKGTWEWVVIGYDLSDLESELILRHGTAGTMREAKVYAENNIGRPQKTIWPTATDDPEVPF